jgi:hypothetical protein
LLITGLCRAGQNCEPFVYLEESAVARYGCRAFGPVEANELQPDIDTFPKLSLPRINLDAELVGKSVTAEKRYSLRPLRLMAAPRQPCVQIEATRVPAFCRIWI